MIDARVPETHRTLDGPAHAAAFDRMQATLRRHGWLETRDIVESGIDRGHALEVGPGPGHLGLDWLAATSGTRLSGLDTSADMIERAAANARAAGVGKRARYVLGSVAAAPFREACFDAVFSSRSLHEWLDPRVAFAELWRVLRPGGRFYLSDLRRDLSVSARRFLTSVMTDAVVREGLAASIAAAYTRADLAALLAQTPFADYPVVETGLGLQLAGVRTP
jgi:ubiquinone/menaquinone biosynthesis C-methylase UbiE